MNVLVDHPLPPCRTNLLLSLFLLEFSLVFHVVRVYLTAFDVASPTGKKITPVLNSLSLCVFKNV